MKFLKKLSLAASIAAVSVAANAEMVALDEVSMSEATGQAGIDLTVGLTGQDAIAIGKITWTDTDTGGSLGINNLTLGSADGSTITLYNAIDIAADGSLTIDSSATDLSGMLLHVDSVDTYTDAGVAAANLVGATDLYMDITGGVTTLSQSGADTTLTSVGSTVEITSDGVNDSSSTLLNGAITLGGLKVYGATEGEGLSLDSTLTFNNAGVSITGLDLSGNIVVSDLYLGANSIGSVAITDLALNGAAITISGH